MHSVRERAVYSITETTCLTFHRTDKTDLDEIEAELIEDDPEAMYTAANMQKARVLK